MTTIGIIGGKGMLGHDIQRVAVEKGYETRIYDLPEFDITDPAAAARVADASDLLINCAAYTAVDRAETDIPVCRAVNADGAGYLAEAAAARGKYFLHFSTDFVFGDDSDQPLDEHSPTRPLGVYGMTKLEGEKLVVASGADHAIVRLQWTYGVNGANFITKILAVAEKRPHLKVVSDQVGAPTATADVARAALALVDDRRQGLFHYAAKGYASRYEVAQFVFATAGIAVTLEPCGSDAFPTPAARPRNSRFNCAKIDAVLPFPRPFWQDSLRVFLSGTET